MTHSKTLRIALGIAGGLLLSLSAASIAASAQAGRATTPMATGFPRLPSAPPIVGYPPQIYMNQLPPGVVRPSFGSNLGFSGNEHREIHRFDQPFEQPSDQRF